MEMHIRSGIGSCEIDVQDIASSMLHLFKNMLAKEWMNVLQRNSNERQELVEGKWLVDRSRCIRRVGGVMLP